MVSRNGVGESRGFPEFALRRVKEVAKKQSIEYLGRTTSDTATLGLSIADVCKCICALTSDHYHESKKYNSYQGWLDVYRIDWPVNMAAYNGLESIYIKFKLDNDLVYIELVSFHHQRYL